MTHTAFRLSRFVAILLFAGLLSAVGGWRYHDARSGREEFRISLSTAQRMREVIWIDARPAQRFVLGHVDGALNVTEEAWESGLEQIAGLLGRHSAIVVYCETAECSASRRVAERLRRELGRSEIWWLEGGWSALRPAGS